MTYNISQSASEITSPSRPTKRRKVNHEADDQLFTYLPTPRRILLEEVDLEVSLRQRLASTIQSRLTWALLLQESLKRPASGQNHADFSDAAFDALTSIERPCDPLFTRDVKPKPTKPLQPLVSESTSSVTPTNPADLNSTSHINTRTRGQNRTARAPPRKLLFLRNNATQPPQIVKLACPDCSRSDFSSLQGLLNHCRLRHEREFGSHDECVQSCAILVEGDEEQAWVVANGTEVAGISLPGLRRLFEIAVGGGRDLLSLTPSSQPPSTPVPEEKSQPDTEPRTSSVSLLARTLGHHEDTPALAPFLGKEAKRRCINVHDEDVDIFSGVTAPSVLHRPWRMHYTHRSSAQSLLNELQEDVSGQTPPDELAGEVAEKPDKKPIIDNIPEPTPFHGIGTRFHIAVRVTIEDRSLWLPPDRRPKPRPNHTHCWRLTVSSPSYSLPINRYLDKLTVSCRSETPPSTLRDAITLDGPPFVVTSTTDRPFLASLTFQWAGAENVTNPPTTVDHWVELDPLHVGGSVLGDQQVLDIELDRRTEPLPIREELRKVTWDWEEDPIDDGSQGPDGEAQDDQKEEPDPPHVGVLKSLLSEVPMTAKDVKGRQPKQVPYFLPTSPAHFRALVHGRRKAVEWGRARALHEAYGRAVQQSEDRDAVANCIPLTVSDVYRWLEDEGQFPRDTISSSGQRQESRRAVRKTGNSNSSYVVPTEPYCRRCGLHYFFHPQAISSSHLPDQRGVKQEPTTNPIPVNAISGACTVFNDGSAELPAFDVRDYLPSNSRHDHAVKQEPPGDALAIPSQPARVRAMSSTLLSSRNLVAVADARLVTAVRNVSATWRLGRLGGGGDHESSFTPEAQRALDLKRLTTSKQETEDELAPYALLSLLTKCMTKLLVRGGVQVLRKDEKALQSLGRYERPRARQRVEVRRLLTPSHVLRGLDETEPRQDAQARGSTMLLLGMLGTADGTTTTTSTNNTAL
ncbi:hypothetical protein K474DRAFT_1776796 [Panus rudis PR-1116 ss-1]|nr:hypothetical protein K474DRAFT_1776796 [Panus rudis PR-1116 ss-1]